VRDEVVDYIHYWHERSDLDLKFFLEELDLKANKFNSWRKRYGKMNTHNGKIPRDFWLTEEEKEGIIDFYLTHSKEGYRRVAYMLLDKGEICVSPSTVYRVLKESGVLRKWSEKKSLKGSGFEQPLMPHEHWHIDISYLNIKGTFYYFFAVLDGCSRYIVHWEIRESMTERDAAIILQKAQENYSSFQPRIISDNGPQFIARDFKELVRIKGMTHVRTSPYYPQSNGKLERFNGTFKQECIRPKVPLSKEEAEREAKKFVDYYNNERLHSAIGYISPKTKLEGKEREIFELREERLAAARLERQIKNKIRQVA